MHYDIPTATAISRALAPNALKWLEDPIPPYNPIALAKVRDASPIPICAGEMFTAEEIRTLVEHSSCDFVNVDLLTVGGIRRARAVVDMAHLFYLPAAIHHNWSMVAAAAASHVAAASANFVAMEMFQGYLGAELMMGLVRESAELVGPGYLRVPMSAGLGISLDEEVCRKFLAPGEHLI
jgi:galactonate dehydratase